MWAGLWQHIKGDHVTSRANDIQGLGETHSGVSAKKVTWPGVLWEIGGLGGGCSGESSV